MRINADSLISTTSTDNRNPLSNDGERNVSSTFASVLKAASAKAPALSEPARLEERADGRRRSLEMAKADPEEGKKIAHGYAHNYLAHALLDMSDRPNIRYSGTGELVTPTTEAYFAKVSAEMQRQCANIYRQEVEKGTSPDQILEKIFEFQDSMPKAFQDMLGI
ncbi:hypothetical protein [Pseudomonas abietaniphila]|uniref:hypothetical protein n=1 Tax=Pseudomonas abietaniphila TaxID=89065 RepID=UPI000AE0F7F6|nr:hypothetical protein [Pseudomonas abietaniphila]